MVNFLAYVKADLAESEKDFEDNYVKNFRSVWKIMTGKNLETLKAWHKIAAKVESIDEFLKSM